MPTLLVTVALILALFSTHTLALCHNHRPRKNPPRLNHPPSVNDLATPVAPKTCPAPYPQEPKENSADPLVELDRSFVQTYDFTRESLQQQRRNDPLIIAYSGRHLVLFHRNTRKQHTCFSEIISLLKTFAHIPLAVASALFPHVVPAPINAPALNSTALQLLHSRLLAARDSWQRSDLLSPEQQSRQEKIYGATHSFVAGILLQGSVSYAQVKEFSQGTRLWVYANVADAARAHVDRLHGVVRGLREEIGEEAWRERLRVAVVSSHMAREGEATLQYFLHALGEQSPGGRVVVAEGELDETQVLDLVAVHYVDSVAAEMFFDDPRRLHRDVMADATADYLNYIPRGDY